jgi:hypothetical protein
MRSRLRTLVFASVAAAGASGILGDPTHAVANGEFYSSGAPAGGQSSGRGGYARYPGRWYAYQAPALNPGVVTGYRYYAPQPMYQAPASNPGAVTGYRYSAPQPTYPLPASNPGAIVSYRYDYSGRR